MSLQVTDAEGNSSSKAVNNPSPTSASLAFAVVPVRISNVQFVNTANGISLTSRLNNGSNNIAIIAVTADSSTNTDTSTNASLKTLLKSIQLRVTHLSGADVTTINGMTIEQVNGNTGSIAGTLSLSNGSGTATFAMTGLGTDAEINNGTMKYYVVKADVTKDTTTDNDDYVKVEFAGFSNGEVTYSSNDTNYSGSNVTDLRVGLTKLDGTQINE